MSIETQSAEFDALEHLIKTYAATIQSVPIVDDDYPEARHRYEGALRDFLRALNDNGRIPALSPGEVISSASMAAVVLGIRQKVEVLVNSREKSLAITKLDEFDMWVMRAMG